MLLPATRPDLSGPLPVWQKLSLILELSFSYVAIRLWLRTKPVAEVASLARRPPSTSDRPLSEREGRYLAVKLAWVVHRTLNHLPGDTRCLTRSLVLLRILARRGIETKLVIGVRADEGFAAHAWVELAGVPLLDPTEFAAGRLVEI
ncbi:MAG TPA: lasso peptide biosynthesis B2 protein [Thermoleophilaceae bacterium]|nr:lasso peptide biosynthesis B2 protein [Thermoleophilaceae bacterium]